MMAVFFNRVSKNFFFVFVLLLFIYPECIVNLDISSCKKEWVQKSTSFRYRVDCSNRGFTEVPKDLPELTAELLLNGNSITKVDEQSFQGLNSLHFLDLSNNEISTIDPIVLQQNAALRKLDLQRNNLKCDWRLWWLVEYSQKLDYFAGQCFSPRPLRGKLIQNVTIEDLSVDCISVKQLTGAMVDGEYSVRVYGHDNSATQISIYCHNMKYGPREYLTLPSGIHKNYVEVAKHKGCDYSKSTVINTFPLSNVTSYFTRVSMDLSTLQIITTDTTFASNTYLRYGQPATCGAEDCMTGVARIDLRGTHFQLKTSKSIIEERSCPQKCGMCDVFTTIQLDLIKKEKQPFPACTLPLGMQNNMIPDKSISASSFDGKHFQPYYARLNSLTYSGWCASKLDGGQYLLIDLGKVKTLSGISTQGHRENEDWVSAYKLMYSHDGVEYQKYREMGQRNSFIGNTDQNTVVTHWFRPRITARYVRIHPQSWYDDGIMEHKICMRIEFYGCENDITSYLINPMSEKLCLTGDFNSGATNNEVSLLKQNECYGPNFMFLFHNEFLMHTQTGLCLHVNVDKAFVFTSNCHTPSILFQKVRVTSGEAFLIKDLNGYCAELSENKNTKTLYTTWQYCTQGGFTILEMSRKGTTAFPPGFTEPDVTIVTDLFQNVSLECQANADPYSVYEWKKTSVIAEEAGYKVSSHIDKSVAVFQNISWNDRGKYQCNAWNAKGSAMKSYEIIVNPLQWFEETPTDQKVIYGRNAFFKCVSRGIPPPITWWQLLDRQLVEYKNISDVNLGKYSILKDGRLMVKSITYEDETKYRCISSSPRLLRNANASLQVYVTQNFTKTPQPSRVLYGNNIVFDCVSIGEPTPNIEWKAYFKRDGREISLSTTTNTAKYEILNNGSLVVKDLDLEDEGRIVCLSHSPGLIRRVGAPLIVYVTQEFVTPPENARVLYGTDHVLKCQVTGTPHPNITWSFKRSGHKKAHPMKRYDPNTYNLLTDGSLQIFNASIAESGVYFCKAKSPGLIQNRTATIEVYVTQEFTEIPSSLTLLRSESATFHCTSVGNPSPEVMWKFVGVQGISKTQEQMQSDSDKYQFNEESVTILNVLNKDEGEYVCISKSPGHIVNVSAELTVHIQPQISLSSSEANILVGQSAEVICAAAGDPTPDVNWYKLQNSSNKIEKEMQTNSNKLSFKPASKQDEGRYICEAQNIAGLMRAAFTLSVKATCNLDIDYSISPKGKHLEQESVTIECQKGFRLNGTRFLRCTTSGEWDAPLPHCEDIDECEEAKDVGSGSLDDQDQPDDTEPETCDIYAQCLNTLGSYQCLCEEGYRMVKNKCEYTPPGSENENPQPATTPPTTTPPPKDYDWLLILMREYNESLITEQNYVDRLDTFSQEILSYTYASWKAQGLNAILKALLIMVKPPTVELLARPRDGAFTKFKSIASICSNILDKSLQDDWMNVDKKYNGSITVMKFIESYTMQLSNELSESDFSNGQAKLFAPKNLRITIQPVPQSSTNGTFVMSSNSNGNDGNEVTIPSVNFENMKGALAIAINYNTINDLLPEPKFKQLESAQVFSQVLSLSFTKGNHTNLKEPITIKFRVKDETPDEKFCSFYDFQKPFGGEWSTEGCKTLNSTSSKEIICECNHLTNFAVLVPLPTGTSAKVIYLTFSLVLAACAGLCVLLAFATCMSHICCSRYTRSDRPAVLCNITVAIMFGILLFAGGVYVSYARRVPDSYACYFCYSLLGILQLFGSAFFAWILVEAVQLFFATRTVIDKGHGHLLLFYFLGWVIPVLILAGTGVLVYLNKFDLQTGCEFVNSFLVAGVVVGAPCILFLIATIVMYVVVSLSIRKNKDLLSPNVIHHTKRSILCSSGLIFFQILVLVGAVWFLNSNQTIMIHYLLAGILAIEGIYLVLYHCFFDRRDVKSNSRQNSKKRNSYSTKDTVTYSPTNTNEISTETVNESKYLIKSSSKRLSNGDLSRSSPPQLRTQGSSSQEAQEWENSYAGMYGGPGSPSSPENQHLLSNQHANENAPPETIYEEEHDEVDGNSTLPRTFGHHNNVSRTSSVPSSRHNSLPRTKKQIMWDDASSQDGRPLKRSGSKASSIVSVETHTSSTNQTLPVYFPAQPPKYEMSLHDDPNAEHYENIPKTGQNMNNIDDYLDSADDSRPTSFGMDSDRMSNISSELSNILYELHAFDTKRHPSETHEYVYKDAQSKTLPNRREPNNVNTDLSRQSSTFKPQKGYSKNDFHEPPSYTDNDRVRILRGRTRAEADPSDGLHANNADSMYSSL